MNRRTFLASALASTAAPGFLLAESPIELPTDHRALMRARKKRIVVQQDVFWVMLNYAKLHPDKTPPFGPFRDVAFSYVDQPGSQIDAVWWDIAGNAPGSAYPSMVAPVTPPPLVERWHRDGIDWIAELTNETRRRKLEVFWTHRISEVDLRPEGGHAPDPDPRKLEHPDWVLPATWWKHGMWNLASPGLRQHKVALLREIATRYDLDGIQIDFARHIPCLPVGRQWEFRGKVTEFLRMTRSMLLEVGRERKRPFLLAARVPQNLGGCHVDGFDVETWARENLVDILTLGSRTMDVDVEGMRAAVGGGVQLQPCFDDHHATDGYRYAPLELLRGVFANHLQRGADSVVTFNWGVAAPELAESIGGEITPQTHQEAFKEVGDLRTLAGKDKVFAVERRGGYPWADGYFNRNDDAPLPAPLTLDGGAVAFTLHVSDAPSAKSSLILRGIFFGMEDQDELAASANGQRLAVALRDMEWKDPQIFSPAPQPPSGGKGKYKVNPKQRLLRVEWSVPHGVWKQGPNRIEISLAKHAQAEGGTTKLLIEKLEGYLRYE